MAIPVARTINTTHPYPCTDPALPVKGTGEPVITVPLPIGAPVPLALGAAVEDEPFLEPNPPTWAQRLMA